MAWDGLEDSQCCQGRTPKSDLLIRDSFPQAFRIRPSSPFYCTVVYTTPSCGLFSFLQVCQQAFEITSKIIFYLKISGQSFQIECNIWLTILFFMPHHTFIHGNGERKCSRKRFGPKLLRDSCGRAQKQFAGTLHPASLAA